VSIGETLAGARDWAGLTIADVSARTHIRADLIAAIERDDFSACDGDLAARGHIRAIAATVGTDPEAMIRQYDAANSPAPSPGPGQPGRPTTRRPVPATGLAIAAVLLLAVIGFAADKVIAGTLDARRLAAGPPAARPVTTGPARLPGSARPSATAAPVTDASPVTTMPVSAIPASATPASATAVSATPVGAMPFGPAGPADGDNPQDAALALSGKPGQSWHTDWYSTPTFGHLKAGTGLLLDLGRTDTITGAAIQLGRIPGADFQLRAGTTPADLTTVAGASDAGGLVRLRLSAPVRGRYLLIWFTRLPPNGEGSYQAYVFAATATVTS
jgi:cytoskeletal protein RodZ